MSYDIIHIPSQRQPNDGKKLELAIAAWLHAKKNASGSRQTEEAYSTTLTAFRQTLQRAGLDLDSDPAAIALVAQSYAASSETGKTVAAATFNRRLACVSSFYRYVMKMDLLTLGVNPIDRVQRRKSQGYASSSGLDPADVRSKLQQIDRSTLAGARDYALLMLALTTGRRLSEVCNLRFGDLSRVGSGKLEVFFRRCKGGKQMRDVLAPAVAQALGEWLKMFYSGDRKLTPESPLWVSLQDLDGSYGKALSIKSLAKICEKRLGISKFHSLRHTFAHSMEQAGAKVSDIQAKLGHSSLSTTSIYLAALKRAENEHADDLAKLFGAE